MPQCSLAGKSQHPQDFPAYTEASSTPLMFKEMPRADLILNPQVPGSVTDECEHTYALPSILMLQQCQGDKGLRKQTALGLIPPYIDTA